MIEIEIIVLTNNIVKPFQNFHKKFNLDFIKSNKLLITKSLAEHGLGFLINIYEMEDQTKDKKLIKKFIFDTGGLNLTFLYNLHVMGYEIDDIDMIILSHWHYDHTGGLYRILLEKKKEVPIFCHESANFERFFIKSDDVYNSDLYGKTKKEITPLLEQSKVIDQEPINLNKISELNGNVKFIKKNHNFLNLNDLKITISGEIPRKHEDEDFSNFYSIQNKDILEVDKILDDKCLIFELEDKIIVLNGCCHSGLKNTLDFVKSNFKKPISHIIGGFHMANIPESKINKTIDYLKNFQVYDNTLYLFPIHCSGTEILRKLYLDDLNHPKMLNIKSFEVSVGTSFVFHT